MSKLTVISQVLAYEDVGATSNPTKRPISWGKTISNHVVFNPGTKTYEVEPLTALTIVDGSRLTSIDNTTEFSLANSPADSNRYRITQTGGTAPVFRTNRSLTCSGVALTLVVNSNLSLTVTAGAGSPFSAVQVGDVVFVPGLSTGDAASPFDALNEGYWSVLSSTGPAMTLARASGTVFSGLSEVVTPVSNESIQAFSAAGVQIGDTVEISAGFASTAQHSYEVLAANPSWFEFESTSPLGPETDVVPGVTGVLFYTSALRFLRIEADQECVVRQNGDTGNTNRLEPLIPGDDSFMASFEKWGPVWKLVIVNRSTARLSLVVMSAE